MANSFRPSAGSVWERMFSKRSRHPLTFACGVRVRDGRVAGERARWRYRRSAVEPVRDADGSVILHHGGRTTLHLRVDAGSVAGGGGRTGEFSFIAVEAGSGANLQISVHGDELYRFGIQY